MMRTPLVIRCAAAIVAAAPGSIAAQATPDAPASRAEAVIDLSTTEGVRLVQGRWRFHEASIIEVDHRNPGPDLKPSGAPNRTHDITPKAGAVDFDRSEERRVGKEGRSR